MITIVTFNGKDIFLSHRSNGGDFLKWLTDEDGHWFQLNTAESDGKEYSSIFVKRSDIIRVAVK